MKFGQLIEYNLRNILLEASCKKSPVETLFPDPFLKDQTWVYLWIDSLRFYTVSFFVCQVEDYQNILKLSCRPLAFTSYKAFLKNKKRSGTSLPASFSLHGFWRKIFLVLLFYLTKFQCLAAFASWDIGQYVYCNSLVTRLWRNKFWN